MVVAHGYAADAAAADAGDSTRAPATQRCNAPRPRRSAHAVQLLQTSNATERVTRQAKNVVEARRVRVEVDRSRLHHHRLTRLTHTQVTHTHRTHTHARTPTDNK